MVEYLHDTLVVELQGPDDWAGFRQACRVLLEQRIPPEHVQWRWRHALAPHAEQHDDLFSRNDQDSLPGRALTPEQLDQLPSQGHSHVRIPRTALRTLRAACMHENPNRFALCHRWLARVQQRPMLKHDALDPDWRRMEHMAKAVGREIHKMHAFVRFRPVVREGQPVLHMAWFEPVHFVVRAASPFFTERFANMHWAILTPQSSLHWDGEQLHEAPGAQHSDAPAADAGESLWLTYYASTFNPARLKPQAMLREMPRKYWKNLPEAVLIDPLMQSAQQRTGQMLAALSAPSQALPETPEAALKPLIHP